MTKMLRLFILSALILPVFFSAGFAKDYRGAEYRTKESFLYGRFEVRMKASGKEGVLSTFFTYFDGLPNDPWATSKWNEIDIEILGRYTNDVQLNTITPNTTNHVSHIWTDFNPADDYHTYAIEWTPDYVSWFIDGVQVRKQSGSHIQTLTRAQKIMMNTWNPAYPVWVGNFNDKVLPAYTFYDWTSYASYTPKAGSVGTSNNFTPQWTDEFTTFDTNRWEKAVHTFGGNSSDFVAENAVINNGRLILCLTLPDNLGYNDISGPKPVWGRISDTTVVVKFSEFVEKTSSENAANYFIPNMTVLSAKRENDMSVVTLKTTPADTSLAYKLFVLNIFDMAEVPRKTSSLSVDLTKVKPLNSNQIKINTGGSKNTKSGFMADKEYSFSGEFGWLDGSILSVPNAISGTTDDSVYQTSINGIAMYKVRVRPGNYKVTLLFSENEFAATNVRVFDITVERSTHKLYLFDVFKLTGKNSAISREFTPVTVNDGELDIHFSAITGNPTLSGLQIDYLGAPTGISEDIVNKTESLQLYQNYPNPFNPVTTIPFTLSSADYLSLKIYDITGAEVYTQNLGYQPAGTRAVNWNGRNNSGQFVSSGTYFFYLQGSNRSDVKKMTIIK